MSFGAVEHPVDAGTRGFPTTSGFRTTSGFDLGGHPPGGGGLRAGAASAFSSPQPIAAAGLGASAAKSQLAFGSPSPAEQYPPSSIRSQDSEQLSIAALLAPTRLDFGSAPRFFAAVPAPPGPAAQQDDAAAAEAAAGGGGGAQFGFKGLLEISQNSGCSGVLGSRTASDEMDSRLLNDCKIEICCTAHTSPAIRRLVKSVIRGLRACQEPDKTAEGMGGTYFFSNDSGAKVAILKPCDEEPLAPNNPKGYVGRQLGDPGWKPTVRVGEAAMREVAAYLLDHDGWARVPTSVLVRARHPAFCYQSLKQQPAVGAGAGAFAAAARRASCLDLEGTAAVGLAAGTASGELPPALLPMKLGSLQEFVQHQCDTTEMGPSRFSARDVHRIGILDIRLFNTDRHAGNMLVRTPRSAVASSADLKSRMVAAAEAQYELVPIDHGFCLPEALEAPYFEWLHWPQTVLPFTEDELQYIHDLDVERDKAILRRELPNLRPECLRVLEVSTVLLQMCAAAGLTLYDVATVMTRPFLDIDEEPSELERICAYARQCIEYAEQMDGCCNQVQEESEDDGASSGSEDSDSFAMDERMTPLPVRASGLLPATAMAAPLLSAGGRGSGGREAESMVFELEEEDSGNVYIKAKLSSMVSQDLRAVGDADSEASSAPYSPGSSLSMEELHILGASHGMAMPMIGSSLMSSGMSGAGLLLQQQPRNSMAVSSVGAASSFCRPGGAGVLGRGSGVLGPAAQAGPVTAPQPGAGLDRGVPMARSVHVHGAGFLWRKLKSQQAAKRAAGAKNHTSGKRACAGGLLSHAYPPPVAAFSPERMSRCFSGMGEEQWQDFMAVFVAQVASALEQGRWQQAEAEKSGGIAMSCPRF